MSRHLQNETAMALTVRLLDLMSRGLTTDAERKATFGRVYEAVAQTLAEHDEKTGRERSRLARPSAN